MARARTVPRIPDPRIEPTLSVKRAGELLGVSRATAYRAAHSGSIPTLNIEGCLRVPTLPVLKMLGYATDSE